MLACRDGSQGNQTALAAASIDDNKNSPEHRNTQTQARKPRTRLKAEAILPFFKKNCFSIEKCKDSVESMSELLMQ